MGKATSSAYCLALLIDPPYKQFNSRTSNYDEVSKLPRSDRWSLAVLKGFERERLCMLLTTMRSDRERNSEWRGCDERW